MQQRQNREQRELFEQQVLGMKYYHSAVTMLQKIVRGRAARKAVDETHFQEDMADDELDWDIDVDG